MHARPSKETRPQCHGTDLFEEESIKPSRMLELIPLGSIAP
jgi:hypothetical protein